MEKKIRIAYFGTPEFAASQLEAILKAGYEVAVVVTMPDKPAGRGRKIQYSDVKKTALEHNLPLLQPEKLKDPMFLEQLASFQANLFIVVAFRMLPAVVWQMPELGTFNLHASLLPQYRGAAPINFAIINGETETGLTTFFLNEEIDMGAVIMREKVAIRPDETAGELHDELMVLGNQVVVETIKKIEKGEVCALPQDEMTEGQPLKPAPKIFKDDMHIRWDETAENILNRIRGLAPYPGAFTLLTEKATGKNIQLKIFEASISDSKSEDNPGMLRIFDHKMMKITTKTSDINVKILQIEGKKQMKTLDFLAGFHLENYIETLV